MPNAFDHALFIVLAVLFPLRAGTFGFRRIELASPEQRPQVRVSVYRQALLIQWGLTLATFGLWIACRRSWHDLGLIPHFGWGVGGVVAGMVIAGIAVDRQRRAALMDDDALSRLRLRMARLELMLPHTRDELALFYKLSITAGICEELLYRGYLIWYLSHWIPFYPAALLASLLFGIGHVYQGWRGVITTSLVGAFLAAVYVISGSLYAGMIMHALMDAHSGHLMQAAYERENAPAESIESHEAPA